MKNIIFILSIFFGQILAAQNVEAEQYSKVKIFLSGPVELQELVSHGLPMDHYKGKLSQGIEVVLSTAEIEVLAALQKQYEIMIPDMNKFYNQRRASEVNTPAMRTVNTASAFGYGSMGSFYTFSEVVSKLDEMRSDYPTLATAKMNIGSSIDGRTIWAVKISDNPDTDESATEAPVHYDALHHAREPLSMAVTINYMFWLLENYGTDAEVTYLLDNRELFFIPVVNPDGYEYNRATNSNGGGLWRKNRRNVASSSCFGVDLNRNYGYQWGNIGTGGSSGNPCSNTYRGTSAFSEPETAAVRNFVNTHNPVIAFSIHSTAGSYLHPFGYATFAEEYQTYSDFSCELLSENDYPYGVTFEMLGYTSNGTTRDWMHGTKGIYAWTPEIDGSGFWPSQSEIFPLVDENVFACKFIAWVAGAYTGIKSYRIDNNKNLLANGDIDLYVELFNKGLSLNANNVEATLSTTNTDVTITNATASRSAISIPPRSALETSTPFTIQLNNNFAAGDEIEFTLEVKQDNIVTDTKTFKFYVGDKDMLFEENAESGVGSLIRSGTSGVWDTTYVDASGQTHSFADSRYGNMANSVNAYFRTPTIDLTSAENPRVEFWAKWAHETNFDYTRFQISTNGGGSWSSLSGEHTVSVSGTPSFTSINNWIEEHIDLSSYIGQNIQLRFFTHTDGGLAGDGFYFDDFKVVDYQTAALPVEFISFNGHLLEDHSVLLNWETASEINSAYFDIQRSTDGINFTNISRIEGQGNSNETTEYKLIDYEASLQGSSAVYYRLKQVDFDDKYEYSNIVEIKLKINKSFLIFPNPARDFISIVSDEKIINLTFYDISGKTFIDDKVAYSGKREVDISNLPPGIYFLNVQFENFRQTRHKVLHIE